MREFHWNTSAIVAMMILFTGLWPVSSQSRAAEPPRISDGSRVTFFYQITIPGEPGFEAKSFGQFVQGQHQLLPALERKTTGMKPGEETKVQLSPDQGFGPYDPKKKKTLPRKDLPAETKEGDVLEDGGGQQATVTQLSDSSAVVDYNHPLAGKPVVVKIKILRVDDPS
ncbi:MAG TPA: FKBP-type peptidyl-prolyl cis-trans isomerase [Nitrospira sp.]|nr:FKBP-type peptidyl-prolyl cis-trans isomerase [Nitrospira sp.]